MVIAVCSSLPSDLALEMKRTGVWQEASPVPLERLSLVKVPFIDFDGNQQEGELVVLDAVADYVTSLFISLFTIGFPIARMRSAHHYGADDELSMADNNSSCYCYRPIEGSTLTSLHSYGLAIDINPLQNPFVRLDEDQGIATIHPVKGWQYLNRRNQKPGMVENIAALVADHGFFVWGGSWTTPIDYHHFQPQRGIAELLAVLSLEDGKQFLEATIKNRHRLISLTSIPSGPELQPQIDLYKRNRLDFFERWTDVFTLKY